MRTLALRAVALAILLAAFPQTSFAQSDARAQSLERYNKGKTHYDLGRFDEAIDEFQKAYELDQNAVYLFNIAQAYRQKGENQRAIFFYKRFLSADPDNPKRDSVEKRIRELEDLIKKGQDVKDKPPENVGSPDDKSGRGGGATTAAGGGATTTPPPADTTPADTDGDGGEVAMTNPDSGDDGGSLDADSGEDGAVDSGVSRRLHEERPIRLFAQGGVALLRFTDPQLAASGLVSLLVGGAYTIPLADAVNLDVGALGTFVSVPWDVGSVSGYSTIITAVATGIIRYAVIADLDIRVEAGLGGLWFAGLGEGNPFTDDGMEPSGPLGMLNIRAALGADYEVGSGFVITATVPAFSFSPASASMQDEIDSIVRFDFLVGLTYAL